MASTPLPLTGTPVHDSADAAANYGAQQADSLGTLERFVTARYASAAAGNSANPTPTAWQLRGLDSPGRVEVYHPTYGWMPLGWSKLLTAANDTSNPTVVSISGVRATTSQLNIGPYPWPHLIQIRYRLFASGPAGNAVDAYININGDTKAPARMTSLPTTGITFAEVVNMGTVIGDTPTYVVGGIQKQSGPDVITAIGSDSEATKLTVTVTPYLTSA